MVLAIGLVLLAVGVTMTVFRRALGIAFCRLGKAIFRTSAFGGLVQRQVEEVYDEKKAPARFLLLGIVNIVQGAAIAVLGVFNQPF